MSDEPKISARYRELPREEPPRHLDDAILAASRRAAETRPAPLVVPSGRRRWYFPLAAAAIIVLAVAVTMHVERERPDAELVVASETKQEDVTEPAKPAAKSFEFAPDPKSGPPATPPREMRAQRDAAPASPSVDTVERARAEVEMAAARARAEAEAEGQARAGALGAQTQAAAARPQAAPAPAAKAMRRAEESQRPASVVSALAVQSPEQWLQGIDDLKRQGRHDEAEKQLAEFRKRYPDYRIPEAILEKFEKR